MKITAVETSVGALPFTMGGPYNHFAGQLWDHLEILPVKIEIEDGLVGWGEAFGHAAIASIRAALDSIIAPLTICRNARNVNGISRLILHGAHLLGRDGPFVFGFKTLIEANSFAPSVRAKDAKTKAPNAPGLGVNPDPAILARHLKGGVARTA